MSRGLADGVRSARATPASSRRVDREVGTSSRFPGCFFKLQTENDDEEALLGAAAVSAVLATPVMAQEATQEPGMIGFNYPNSRYLTGGYGVRTPYNTGRYPRMPYYRYVYYVPGPVGVVGGAVGIAAVPFVSDSYAYYEPY